MAVYWAEANGTIIEAEYNPGSDRLTHDEVKNELNSALILFGHTATIQPVTDDPKEEVYKVNVSNVSYSPIYVCIKEMTPGGGGTGVSRSKNEQSVQPNAKYINDAFNRMKDGVISIHLGVYKRGDATVFCAWKLKPSGAYGPTRRQVKIETIAAAIKDGFAQQDKGYGEYACAFRPEYMYFYIPNSGWLHSNPAAGKISLRPNITEIPEHNPIIIDESSRIKGGDNYLLYGVPGSGKSHTVKIEYCNDEQRMERVVFHPDYTYSDFIGQIMPKLDEERRVYYDFAPGPFTRMLQKAHTNPQMAFFLVIEELNRGNAPAIFGEVFQLLDRKKEEIEGTADIQIGESSYGITNTYVAEAVYGTPEHLVFIPSNLSIVATMNTSDQNVFTLDTAFQRRWRMRMIENNIKDAAHARKQILDTSVTWGQFNTAINQLILEANSRLSSSEDKRLGAYFVTPSEIEFSTSPDPLESNKQNSRFPEKVLKYLWDDAFKFSRGVIFNDEAYKSLEDIIKTFMSNSGDNRFISIFREGVLGDLSQTEQ